MKTPRRCLLSLIPLVFVVGCGMERMERAAPTAPNVRGMQHDRAHDSDLRLSDWSTPANLGEPINTASVDQSPAISRDGLTIFFHSNRDGGFGLTDLWVCQRESVDSPWGTPQNLGDAINTSANDGGVSLSHDGHLLFFQSNRPGGFGDLDLYVARRRDKSDPRGWGPAQNLGSGVNTAALEGGAQPFEDDATGTMRLYFHSDRSGGQGGTDIYVATQQAESFGAVVSVEELNSAGREQGPAIRRDGLEAIFVSDRPGTLGLFDLWVSTRPSVTAAWSTPTNLGSTVNSTAIDGGPEFSFDGKTLYFHSPRPTGVGPQFDIWMTTRTKVKH